MALDAVTDGWATLFMKNGKKSDHTQEVVKIVHDILVPLGYVK